MKVLAINSSVRKAGNTAILIRHVFEKLVKEGIETETIQLAGQVIEPHRACGTCGGQENCVHCRDNFRDIFGKMKEADGIVLGSPVYSANVSANMQALLERAAVVCDMNLGLLPTRWEPPSWRRAERSGRRESLFPQSRNGCGGLHLLEYSI